MINVRLKKTNGLASAYLMRQQREKHDSAIGARHFLGFTLFILRVESLLCRDQKG
jgi:hypothetical protein